MEERRNNIVSGGIGMIPRTPREPRVVTPINCRETALPSRKLWVIFIPMLPELI